jgi:hypothetical protein
MPGIGNLEECWKANGDFELDGFSCLRTADRFLPRSVHYLRTDDRRDHFTH